MRHAFRLLAVVFASVLSISAHGQSMWTRVATATGAVDGAPFVAQRTESSTMTGLLSGAASWSYYDSQRPIIDWTCPAVYNPLTVVVFAERLTLPGHGALVDSVQVRMDSVWGDSIIVLLLPDTLYPSNLGFDIHLINIFDPSATALAKTTVAASDFKTHAFTTVAFPHVPVPREFYVGFTSPIKNNSFTGWYQLGGDSGVTHARTTDNMRSAYVAAYSGSAYSGVVDSTFILTGASVPVFTNFYVKLFADTATMSVDERRSLEAPSITAYPSPCTDRVTFETTSNRPANLQVCDVLGRRVMQVTVAPRAPVTLNTRSLAPGVYTVFDAATKVRGVVRKLD